MLFELCLQQLLLAVQPLNGVIDVGEVQAHGLYAPLLVFYLGVKHHKVLQAGLDVLLVLLQTLLLLTYLALQLLALVLQSLDGRIRGCGGRRLLLFLLLRGFLLLGRLFLPGGFLFLLHSSSCRFLGCLLTLLCARSQTKTDKQ